MRATAVISVAVLGLALFAGTAGAQAKKDCAQPSASPNTAQAPQKIEGKVVSVDPAAGKVTVQSSNGTTHEFSGSKQEIQNYKVGDQITATLRSQPGC